jgi:hypothetical protein
MASQAMVLELSKTKDIAAVSTRRGASPLPNSAPSSQIQPRLFPEMIASYANVANSTQIANANVGKHE